MIYNQTQINCLFIEEPKQKMLVVIFEALPATGKQEEYFPVLAGSNII